MTRISSRKFALFLSCLLVAILPIEAFVSRMRTIQNPAKTHHHGSGRFGQILNSPVPISLKVYNDEEEKEQIEEARIRIWTNRRSEIRSMLKSAEALRNFRIANGFVPELDEDGNTIKTDGKTAVTLTAFAVAAGAIILRVGGRAALVSAVGLDFVNDNPEMQDQINQVLQATESVDPLLKAFLFCVGWTLVKTLCLDAGGIVLAFASGILFGGVVQGAVMSALGATVGSSVAFALAKADTPVRKKAIEIVDENPSLRGLEKVVAEEGLKAVLTFRLAPVLPIPLGMYNYVYGITNVRYLDFAGGIFLGSLKPYFLDSYLGYFGKSLLDGTASEGGMQDYVLIGILGFSVLIGVFASQLASETWEAIQREEEADRLSQETGSSDDEDKDSGIMTEIFGLELPQWIVGFQYGLQDANVRMNNLVLQELDAKVWNCTSESMFSKSDIPDNRNPAIIDPNSPELAERYQGVDFGATTCDGLVLSPILFSFFLKFADPFFDEVAFKIENEKDIGVGNADLSVLDKANELSSIGIKNETTSATKYNPKPSEPPLRLPRTIPKPEIDTNSSLEFKEGIFLNQLQEMKDEAKELLAETNKKLDEWLKKNNRSL